MYIRRLIVKDCPATADRDLTFWNDWTNAPLRKVLFTGPNGSGKTTLLRLIAALWEVLPAYLSPLSLTPPNDLHSSPISDVLQDVGLAAIEINDLLDKPLWVYAGSRQSYIDQLKAEAPDAYFAGVSVRKDWREPEPNTAWAQDFYNAIQRLQIGAASREAVLPNLAFFEAENRQLLPLRVSGQRTAQYEEPYRWLVGYEPTQSVQGHIETMLQNLKIRDPQWFYAVRDKINQFYVGKQLADFDNALRLMVQVENGETHFIDQLSAGERQVLVLMFMIERWLHRGGIAIIDEPDLHLHVSMHRQLLSHLVDSVSEQDGQLFVTAHSPRTWQLFDERETFNFDVSVLNAIT